MLKFLLISKITLQLAFQPKDVRQGISRSNRNKSPLVKCSGLSGIGMAPEAATKI